jgi:hypothetical protein
MTPSERQAIFQEVHLVLRDASERVLKLLAQLDQADLDAHLKEQQDKMLEEWLAELPAFTRKPIYVDESFRKEL